MKLRSEARRTFQKSADVLLPHEELQPRIFDPRLDLPAGEYAKFRDTVKRDTSFKGPKRFKIPHVAWISWFDPSYRDDLRGVDKYKEQQVSELFIKANQVHGFDSQMRVLELNLQLARVLQQFPETRKELKELTEVSRLEYVMEWIRDGVDPQMIVNWIQIWPEHRARIMQAAFPKGLEGFLKQEEQNLFDPPSNQVNYAADLSLLFPESKAFLLQLIKDALPRERARLRELSKSISPDDFKTYHRLIGDLTILGAEQATIDQHGLIQVELQPLHKLSVVPPLPDRSTL
ncbi:MAG: hypothetical protein AAB558_05175 [Patescibacteria group bacterium]